MVASDRGDLAPGKAEAYNCRGEARTRMGDLYLEIGDPSKAEAEWDRAIEDLTRGIELGPEDFGAYYLRGTAYRSRGDHRSRTGDTENAPKDFKEAIGDFTRALDVLPGNEDSLIGRGLARQANGDYAAALPDHQAAVKKNPKSALSQGSLAICLLGLGRQDEALKAADRAVALDPVNSWAHFWRAKIHVARSLPDKAIRDLEDYLKRAKERQKAGEAKNLLKELRPKKRP